MNPTLEDLLQALDDFDSSRDPNLPPSHIRLYADGSGTIFGKEDANHVTWALYNFETVEEAINWLRADIGIRRGLEPEVKTTVNQGNFGPGVEMLLLASREDGYGLRRLSPHLAVG